MNKSFRFGRNQPVFSSRPLHVSHRLEWGRVSVCVRAPASLLRWWWWWWWRFHGVTTITNPEASRVPRSCSTTFIAIAIVDCMAKPNIEHIDTRMPLPATPQSRNFYRSARLFAQIYQTTAFLPFAIARLPIVSSLVHIPRLTLY